MRTFGRAAAAALGMSLLSASAVCLAFAQRAAEPDSAEYAAAIEAGVSYRDFMRIGTEQAAVRHNVPVNVLMAMTEKDLASVPRPLVHIDDTARRLRAKLDQGQRIEDIVDPATLERAYQIWDDLYAPSATREDYEAIAIKENVPANILRALSELNKETKLSQVQFNARALRSDLDSGEKIESIVNQKILNRAIQIGRYDYGLMNDEEKPHRPSGLYDYFFGYKYAEECAAKTASKDAAQACYELYPSLRGIKDAERKRAESKGIPLWSPGK